MQKEFLFINFVFILVCLFVQLRSQQTPGTQVHHSHVHFNHEADENFQSTEPFELRGAPSALRVSFSGSATGAGSAPSSSWVGLSQNLETELVEIRNKQKYHFEIKSGQTQALLSSVPSGVYLLSFARTPLNQPLDFDVTATYGAKSWSNFIFEIIFLILPSLFVVVMNQIFEFKRRKTKKDSN